MRPLLLLLVSICCACSVRYSSDLECVRDAECPEARICSARGQCIESQDDCTSNDDCSGDQLCSDGACAPAMLCASTNECPALQLCINNSCTIARCDSDTLCSTDQVCDLATGVCKATPCTNDSMCADGLRCDSRNGACKSAECSRDNDCDLDERCDQVSGLCFIAESCLTDADCASDQICGIGRGICIDGDRDSDAYAKPFGPELCDGADNDRDGEIDEDFVAELEVACTASLGSCENVGLTECSADGNTVVCDADQPSPSPELCDGLDNDCDGLSDEDFVDKGNACTTGEGACEASGVWGCSADGTQLECSATALTPTTELCDGLDNDCDGDVDEDYPELGVACGAGVGACRTVGTLACLADGSGTSCTAVSGAAGVESCNEVDDDCDGERDEDLFQSCSTDCGTGTETCVNGLWSGCTASTPTTESCNYIDDDCDGEVDEGCDDSWTGGARP